MAQPSPQIPVFLFAFANDDGRSLRQLDEEQRAIRQIFSLAEDRKECKVVVLTAATSSDVIQAFQKYRGRINIFHYGGHSNQERLFLKEENPKEKGYKAENLAEFLGSQPELKLLFLNSCLSQAQAKRYHESGVQAVIATSRSIGDFAARKFATLFYRGILTGAELGQAFQEAENSFKREHEDRYQEFRDLLSRRSSGDKFPWELSIDKSHAWWLPKAPPSQDPDQKRSPVRGLLAFEAGDARLFQNLQRNQEVERCREAIIRKEFSVGVLSGESGCGKTSFLQAGLQQTLQKTGHGVVYVKFSDLPPMESIRRAIRRTTGLRPPEDAGFQSILPILTRRAKRPIVFFFDQFEQFFTHHPTQEDRAPFIEELNNWYSSRDQYPCKILFSVRKDMLYLSYELQGKLGYKLTPKQNYFQLKKFTPQQATEIFRFMAGFSQVEFEEKFIHQMCAEELASKDDGLVSAVEIQILAMMLEGQKTAANRAFTREVYEKFGGISGLLQRFVKEQLDTPTIHNKNQDALKVLLALADLDQNVRAGVFTQAQLQGKLNGLVATERLPGILKWLCSVRLANQIVEENQPIVYELAHERLIIPLRNLARKTLSRIDRLSHLLDRRVNEWMGNKRSSRYLFNLRELWALRKYRRLISWEPKREQKETLIKASRLRWQKRLSGLAALLLVPLAFLIFLQTPLGIITKVRYLDFSESLKQADLESRQEAALLLAVSHPELAKKAASGIYKSRELFYTIEGICDSLLSGSSQRLKLVEELYELAESYRSSIDDDLVSWYSSRNLTSIARVAAANGEPLKAIAYLEAGLDAAQKMKDPDDRAHYLIKLAQAAGEIGQTPMAIICLEEGLAATQNSDDRIHDLIKLAQTAGEIGQTPIAIICLEEGFSAAQKIRDAEDRSEILHSLDRTASVLAKSAKDPTLLKLGHAIAQTFEPANSRVYALIRVAEIAREIEHPQKSITYLEEGLAIVQDIDDANKRACLIRIAQAANKIGQIPMVVTCLEQHLATTHNMGNVISRAYTLISAAKIAWDLRQALWAITYLEEGVAVAQKIAAANDRAKVLLRLSQVTKEIGQTQRTIICLEEGFAAAQKIADAKEYIDILISLAQAADGIGQTQRTIIYLEEGLAAAQKIADVDDRVNYLIRLAQAAKKIEQNQKAIIYLEEGLAAAQKIADVNDRAKALIDLAQAAREIGQTQKAITYLEEELAVVQEIEAAKHIDILISLVQTAEEIGQNSKAIAYLEAGFAMVKDVREVYNRGKALNSLTEAVIKLAKNAQDVACSEQIFSLAKNIENPDDLIDIIRVAGEHKCWKEAYAFIKSDSIPSEDKVIGYAWILRLWNNREEKLKPKK